MGRTQLGMYCIYMKDCKHLIRLWKRELRKYENMG